MLEWMNCVRNAGAFVAPPDLVMTRQWHVTEFGHRSALRWQWGSVYCTRYIVRRICSEPNASCRFAPPLRAQEKDAPPFYTFTTGCVFLTVTAASNEEGLASLESFMSPNAIETRNEDLGSGST